jgi:ABC-2 type transport system ATP-binding protein
MDRITNLITFEEDQEEKRRERRFGSVARRVFFGYRMSMPEAVVEIRNVTKLFKAFKAVDDVSFDVRRGEILGLLGPNGAGKTTIIHMLLGLTTPNSGSIKIFGLDLARHREEILGRTNFSSTYIAMPYSLKVWESLRVFAALYRVRKPDRKIEEVLKTFEIPETAKMSVRHLSTGQLTRLNLAKAMINDPEVLFLDEPTASLDPDIADKVRKFLLRIKRERGISILLTSHNMKEMEEVSDRIIFLHKGRIIAEGGPREVIEKFQAKSLEEAFLKVTREGELVAEGETAP